MLLQSGSICSAFAQRHWPMAEGNAPFRERVCRVRQELRELQDLVNVHAYPAISDGIHSLLKAFDDEMEDIRDSASDRRRNRRKEITVQRVEKLQKALTYQSNKARKVAQELALERGARLGLKLQTIWLVRTGLSKPTIPARSLVDMCNEFPLGNSTNVISHQRVSVARDVFAELIKHCNRVHVQKMVRESSSALVVLRHVHDEASMRLKSFAAVDDARYRLNVKSVRGRSSKVPNHAMTVFVGEESAEWFTELQPLQRKDAKTIATTLLQNVEEVMSTMSLATSGDREGSLLHIVVGDGIGTNAAAARYLLPMAQKLGLESNIDYKLVVLKCGSHAANLVVMVAVCGRILSNPVENDRLAGTCSRVFKHIIPDYIEEISFNLRKHVMDNFLVTQPPDKASMFNIALLAHDDVLQKIYGKQVLPDTLMQFFNCGIGFFGRELAPGEAEMDARATAYSLLYRYLLRVEDRPTVTRFWLFADCVYTLMRFYLLGLPSSLLRPNVASLRADNQARVAKVIAYLDRPITPFELRKVCVCLQVALHATSITAQVHVSDTPTLVRLGRGTVQDATSEQVCSLLRVIDQDPELDSMDAAAALLTTLGHIFIRFSYFLAYPTRLWSLTRKYNPADHPDAIEAFLDVDDRFLDQGYSAPLRKEALSKGDRGDAMSFMVSSKVQSELEQLFAASTGSSLDVERKHKQDKAGETTKMTSVARGSRNSIILRYLLQRRSHLAKTNVARARQRHASRINIRALAIRRRPDLASRPRGHLHWEVEDSTSRRRAVAYHGDDDALKTYIDENHAFLAQERDTIREAAKSLTSTGTMPFTNEDWVRFIDSNTQLFQDQMKHATERRRYINERLAPMANMDEVPRVAPQESIRAFADSPLTLRKLASVASGFVLVKGSGLRAKEILFICTLNKECWALRMSRGSGKTFWLSLKTMRTDFCSVVDLAEHIGWDLLDDSTRVFSLEVAWSGCDGDAAWMHECTHTEVPEPSVQSRGPAHRRKRARASDETEVSGDEASGATHSAVSDSDVVSACSDEESSACEAEEKAASDIDEAEQGAAAVESSPLAEGDDSLADRTERATAGTHVVEELSDGYFTMTDNPNYHNLRVGIKARWAAEMGAHPPKSNNLLPRTFGEEKSGDMKVTFTLLQAWTVFRFQQNGFCDAKPSRRAWLAHKVDKLRRDVVKRFGPAMNLGSEHANALAREFAPEVFAIT